jgi:hypothetical protein
MKHVPPPEGEPLSGLDNLAMAVPPKWGEAVLRLAKATERVAAKLDEMPGTTADVQYIPKARELAKSLIDFLDGLEDTDQDTAVDDGPCCDNELDGPENEEDEDSDPAEPCLGSLENFGSGNQELWAGGNRQDLEDEHDGAEPPEDAEPSLGSFDRMLDQTKSWDMRTDDGFFSSSDCEQDDCDKEDDDPEELSEASGIGDQDGLQEQFSGWIFPSGLEIKGVW